MASVSSLGFLHRLGLEERALALPGALGPLPEGVVGQPGVEEAPEDGGTMVLAVLPGPPGTVPDAAEDGPALLEPATEEGAAG